MSLSRQILIGLVAGIALGLCLGDLAAPLQILAGGYHGSETRRGGRASGAS